MVVGARRLLLPVSTTRRGNHGSAATIGIPVLTAGLPTGTNVTQAEAVFWYTILYAGNAWARPHSRRNGGERDADAWEDHRGRYAQIGCGGGGGGGVGGVLCACAFGAGVWAGAGLTVHRRGGPGLGCVQSGGGLLAVANAGSQNVSVFSVNQTTGALTQVSGSPVAVGRGSEVVAFSPSGGLLVVGVSNYENAKYVAAAAVFSVNQTTGALTPVPGSPFETFPYAGSYLALSVAFSPKTGTSSRP